MKERMVYQRLAELLAWEPTEAFKASRTEQLAELVSSLPSGSGWDNGTKLSDKSTPNRIVLYGAFHHMSEHGYYDGWTEHEVIITPSLAYGFELRITGRNRNDIKDYLHEMFTYALREAFELPTAAVSL